MRQFKISKLLVMLVTATFMLSGCFGGSGTQDEERPRVKYQGSTKRVNRLEVPPQLSPVETTDTMPLPDVNFDDTTIDLSTDRVLRDPGNVSIERDGQIRWLVVNEPVAEVWPKIVGFWEKDGVQLITANPNTGVVETDWLVNYADFTSKFQRLFQGLLNTVTQTGTRDKYRMRIDHGVQPGTTEIYVTHIGVEEVAVDERSNKEIPEYEWQNRKSDPNLEAEVLRLLMVDLGVDEQMAESLAFEEGEFARQDKARLMTDSDEPVLLLNYDENRSWRRVGSALDRMDVVMVGYNRDQGAYVIDANQIVQSDKGFFSRLWNRESKEELVTHRSQVRLIPQEGNVTLVAVATEEGVHDSSDFAVDMLNQLYEILK